MDSKSWTIMALSLGLQSTSSVRGVYIVPYTERIPLSEWCRPRGSRSPGSSVSH